MVTCNPIQIYRITLQVAKLSLRYIYLIQLITSLVLSPEYSLYNKTLNNCILLQQLLLIVLMTVIMKF
jgi:hypothetical protein